ncbi:MAG: 4-hydroxybenzoate 3-monooxygenase [Pseudonocardiales bacterium]|nr:MAG: 4-hydroxybenzoate 3-monooxygenase [Pseudonocardiales bacterium]
MRTDVAIVGAGPAGLVLAHLLARAGIGSVVLETHSREHVESRVRAGVLEAGTADLLERTGVGDRMRQQGMIHRGIELSFGGRRHRVDLAGLTGRTITVYGQQEVVRDLIAARLGAGLPLIFDAKSVRLSGLDTSAPLVRFRHDGEEVELTADVVAGCDGHHGVCRQAVPDGVLRTYRRDYPYAWLGVLAQAPPASEELVYTRHERGFALFSMRSPAVTRLYLQVAPDEDVAGWPDERIWAELHRRLRTNDGFDVHEGDVLEKGVTPMRSVVTEPMRYGRLFLAGDAAHIVPPTGAKGMNLAIADVAVLAGALVTWYATGDEAGLAAYSRTCLRRVWRVQHFSWWMTSMLHATDRDDPYEHRLQLAQLDSVTQSLAYATSLAENYVGLPLDCAAAGLP